MEKNTTESKDNNNHLLKITRWVICFIFLLLSIGVYIETGIFTATSIFIIGLFFAYILYFIDQTEYTINAIVNMIKKLTITNNDYIKYKKEVNKGFFELNRFIVTQNKINDVVKDRLDDDIDDKFNRINLN